MSDETSFEEMVLAEAREASEQPFEAIARFDSEGDSLEFIARRGSYYAERIDDRVTVYYSHTDNEIIGSLIKNVRELRDEVLKTLPGFAIFVDDGRVRLSHLFLAKAFSSPPDSIPGIAYRKLVDVAEETRAEANLEACAS